MRRDVLPCPLFVGLEGSSKDRLEVRGRGTRGRGLGHGVIVGCQFGLREKVHALLNGESLGRDTQPQAHDLVHCRYSGDLDTNDRRAPTR